MRRAILLAFVCAACGAHELRGATRDSVVRLPRDHAAHDDAQTEWWHWHGHLSDDQQRRYDWFLVFIKQHTDLDHVMGLPVRWFVDPFEVAYFSVLDRETGRFMVRERHAYPDTWAAHTRTDRLNPPQLMGGTGEEPIPDGRPRAGRGLRVVRGNPRSQAPIRMGDRGFVEFPPDSSHLYYTMPRMRSRGTLTVDGERRAVHGPAWFKHQWGFLYSETIAGWDWFGAQLSNGLELEIALVFDRDWNVTSGSYAVVFERDGSMTRLDLSLVEVRQTGEVWRSPRTDTVYPIGWVLALPRRDAMLALRAVAPAQEMVVFPANLWAGTLAVEGTFDGEPVTGDCFSEILGRDEPHGRGFFSSGRPDEGSRHPGAQSR